jgi:hypothetical protein
MARIAKERRRDKDDNIQQFPDVTWQQVEIMVLS